MKLLQAQPLGPPGLAASADSQQQAQQLNSPIVEMLPGHSIYKMYRMGGAVLSFSEPTEDNATFDL